MQVYQTNFYNLKDQKLGNDELSNLIKEGISVNSTAFLDFSEEKVKTLGNPTEAALLLWLNSQQQNYLTLREEAPVMDQLTFSTERKYMATVVKSPLLGKKAVSYTHLDVYKRQKLIYLILTQHLIQKNTYKTEGNADNERQQIRKIIIQKHKKQQWQQTNGLIV